MGPVLSGLIPARIAVRERLHRPASVGGSAGFELVTEWMEEICSFRSRKHFLQPLQLPFPEGPSGRKRSPAASSPVKVMDIDGKNAAVTPTEPSSFLERLALSTQDERAAPPARVGA